MLTCTKHSWIKEKWEPKFEALVSYDTKVSQFTTVVARQVHPGFKTTSRVRLAKQQKKLKNSNSKFLEKWPLGRIAIYPLHPTHTYDCDAHYHFNRMLQHL